MKEIMNSSRLIELTQGYLAIVDDEDYRLLIQWNWYAHKDKGGNVYAIRNIRLKDKTRTALKLRKNILASLLTLIR